LADRDPGCLPRAGLLSNHDLDIEIDRRQQVHQSLKREAGQPVVAKRREAGLRDAKRLGSRGLRKLARFEYLIQGIGEAQPDLALGGSGNPRSANTFWVPRVTGSVHSTFRLAIVLS
jgi:hypothetical protein